MKTRIEQVDPLHPEPRAIAAATAVLRAGGLVAFPTETVYGLGARVFDEHALKRVFSVKGRPTTHPLIVHVAGEREASELAASWNERASRIARAFWPGPLTLVVDRAAEVPSLVSGGGSSVALRAPSHPVAMALLEALGEPIAAPSANLYQCISPTRAEHVLASLDGRIEFLLDAGPCPVGIESTVVDVREGRVQVLRPGMISLSELRRVDPTADAGGEVLPAGAARASPGMDARHYAPRATLGVARDRAAAIAEAHARSARQERIGLVLHGAKLDEDSSLTCSLVVVTLPDEARGYGQRLYSTLFDLDHHRVSAIIVEPVPKDDAWSGVRDRLHRASTPR
jgi:L-threonylcarbamoyladenylate synthase